MRIIKSLVVVAALFINSSFGQTIKVGYDVYFEQDIEILGKSSELYPNGDPYNESGYVHSLMSGPSSCWSWTSIDYWDTFGTYTHSETDFDCNDTVPNLLLGGPFDFTVYAGWSYVTNLTVLVRPISSYNTVIFTSVSEASNAWVDWSGTAGELRITYNNSPTNFSKWAWDGSINPSYVEPLVLKRGKGKHRK